MKVNVFCCVFCFWFKFCCVQTVHILSLQVLTSCWIQLGFQFNIFFFLFFLAENIAFFSLLQQAPITSNLCSFPSLLTNISILGSQITGTEIKFFCYLLILKIVVGMVYTLINSTGAAISTVDDINISSTPTNRVSHELKQIAYMLN